MSSTTHTGGRSASSSRRSTASAFRLRGAAAESGQEGNEEDYADDAHGYSDPGDHEDEGHAYHDQCECHPDHGPVPPGASGSTLGRHGPSPATRSEHAQRLTGFPRGEAHAPVGWGWAHPGRGGFHRRERVRRTRRPPGHAGYRTVDADEGLQRKG